MRSLVGRLRRQRSKGTEQTTMGCDIHTHAHARDSSQNNFAEEMSTAGSL